MERLPNRESQNPADLVVQKELGNKLLSAVDTLSPKHRAVFILHAMENLSYKEIAGVVGCSIGTVMSRLFYARKKLQEILCTGCNFAHDERNVFVCESRPEN